MKSHIQSEVKHSYSVMQNVTGEEQHCHMPPWVCRIIRIMFPSMTLLSFQCPISSNTSTLRFFANSRLNRLIQCGFILSISG